jgi:hypothetical protein
LRKVETKIQPLSFIDAQGNEHSPDFNIKVTNAWNWRTERVVLDVAGCKYEVLTRDLIAAIQNATNFERGE